MEPEQQQWTWEEAQARQEAPLRQQSWAAIEERLDTALRKREIIVETIKRTREYQQVQLLLAQGELDVAAVPLTPPATDKTIPNRAWEKQVREWRTDLRRLLGWTHWSRVW